MRKMHRDSFALEGSCLVRSLWEISHLCKLPIFLPPISFYFFFFLCQKSFAIFYRQQGDWLLADWHLLWWSLNQIMRTWNESEQTNVVVVVVIKPKSPLAGNFRRWSKIQYSASSKHFSHILRRLLTLWGICKGTRISDQDCNHCLKDFGLHTTAYFYLSAYIERHGSDAGLQLAAITNCFMSISK